MNTRYGDALSPASHANTCDACPAPAAYTRKYSGQTLCVQCFVRSISRKVAKTISRYKMIQKNDQTIAVAVSGGKDSLALLKILHEIVQKRHNLKLVVITIDEGIPGYRDEALRIVSDVCGDMGVLHHVYAYRDLFDVTLAEALDLRDGRAKAPSSCSICGTLRRRAIDVAARDVGADVVATGHNLDDMLQTFMINMMSGDTDKIAWMDPGGAGQDISGAGAPATGGAAGRGARRIKPFCEIYESEIVYYAFASKLPFQEEPCPHMNEGIRTAIREFLNLTESERSGIKNSMYASVLRMIRLAHDAAATTTTDTTTTTAAAEPVASGQGAARMVHAPQTQHLQESVPAWADTTRARADAGLPTPIHHKKRTQCLRCGAECTGGGGNGGGVCSVCEIMAGLGRSGNRNMAP